MQNLKGMFSVVLQKTRLGRGGTGSYCHLRRSSDIQNVPASNPAVATNL
jgi:hypothetical protein